MPNKRPLDRIKSFLKVNLDNAFRKGSFSTIISYELLQKIYVIIHIFSSRKSILSRANDILEHIS
jgi:hypothetical protein